MSGHISIDLPPDFPSPLSCTEYYAGESVRLVRYSQKCLLFLLPFQVWNLQRYIESLCILRLIEFVKFLNECKYFTWYVRGETSVECFFFACMASCHIFSF